jgi:hypothetical protein
MLTTLRVRLHLRIHITAREQPKLGKKTARRIHAAVAKPLQTGTRIKLVVQTQSQPDNIATLPLLTAKWSLPKANKDGSPIAGLATIIGFPSLSTARRH